jgi:hypothetical protein
VSDSEPARIVIRPVHTPEALTRLEERLGRMQQRKVAVVPHGADAFGVEFAGVDAVEDEQKKLAREVAEADVVAAARRSQAEIRRHVDSYLKEHFEGLVATVTSAVLAQVTSRVMEGISAQQEAQGIALDRIAADVRSQLRAFARGVAKPKKGAKKRAQAK